MNIVFVSPHFPSHVWKYCKALKERGMNVLGVADMPYEALSQELRDNLCDYYQVINLEDRSEMQKALGYFTWRHGKIDFLESNNEYWLEKDAYLRRDFNISSGLQPEDMDKSRSKANMKTVYAKAGVKTAPWHLADTLEKALEFVSQVGYPLVVKPDRGVGALGTYRIANENDLRNFFSNKPVDPYIMESYVYGEICSYDAIIDSRGEALFETGNITPGSIMDIVNEKLDCVFYIVPKVPEDLIKAGRACVKAWNIKSRYIHFEFFRLLQDQEGLGKKGDIIGLEVNLRPSGGLSPEMTNYANSVDVYQLWADMICYDKLTLNPDRERFYCVFVGRRESKNHKHSHDKLLWDWSGSIVLHEPVPRALADTMGEQAYLARLRSKDDLKAFLEYALDTN